MSEFQSKIAASHLHRDAYLYVRQSTVRQVFENVESRERQYALRQRAVALGWPLEHVVVVDDDQGQSGASTQREGFQRLVTEVSMGRAGLVLGLEVSRLARNSVDWQRLLEICALTDTLILDEDGVYNPANFNDRLLLGLKGTMSEAELHVIRARLRGGMLNKARRGELRIALPGGLVYDANDRVVLDPDRRVQQSVRHLFQVFRRTGSATATVKAFREQQLEFPRRLRGGPRKGQLVWGPLTHTRVLRVLHSPRYAGAFTFGRHRSVRQVDGSTRVRHQPRDQWHTLLRDAHPGYISWEEYEDNQKRLCESAQAHGAERRKSPPREGPALLQGLVVCGVCGARMTVRYHQRRGRLLPNYVCQSEGIENAVPKCQELTGAAIDEAVGTLLLETVTPTALEVALQVQQELERRELEVESLRRCQVEQARYEVELARSRFMQVDPNNRLVADSLEAEWNEKLRTLAQAQEQHEKQCAADRKAVSEHDRRRVLALASDFPALWNNPATPDRERKRVVRLLIEDVTLTKSNEITAHIRFKGGASHTLQLPRPLRAWEARKTHPDVVEEIDKLLNAHTEGEIAVLLCNRGFVSGLGKSFDRIMVQRLRRDYDLKPRYQRLRDAGLLTTDEISQLLGVAAVTVKQWRRHGLLQGYPYNDKGQCLYERPGDAAPTKLQGRKLSERRRFSPVASNGINEVQYEA